MLCGKKREDVHHALVECRWAKEIWTHGLSNSAQVFFREKGPFVDNFWNLLDKGHEEDIKKTCYILWFIWYRRNLFLHEGKRLSAEAILGKCNDMHQDFQASQVLSVPPPPSQVLAQTWSPPEHGFYKLNVDGSTFVDSGSIGVGAVIRNSTGEVMLAMTEKLICDPCPEMAESWAIIHGLSIAIEADFTRIVLKGDAKNVLTDFCSNSDLFSSHGTILEDAKKLKSSFFAFSVSFVRRTANSVAHLLAKMSGLWMVIMSGWRMFLTKFRAL